MKTKVFQAVAGLAGVYHALLAAVGTFASTDTIQSIIRSTYGVNLTITDQMYYVVKFTSAYFTAFAVAMLLLAWKPVQYSNLVWVAVGLFGMRLLDRLLFYNGLKETFQFGLTQELFTIGTISTIMILLVVLRPRTN